MLTEINLSRPNHETHLGRHKTSLSLSLFQSGQSKFCFKNISRDSNLTDNGADSFPFFCFGIQKC